MIPLYDFDPDIQLKLIGSHLQKYGKITRQMRGTFGEIFLFGLTERHEKFVAKCPNIKKFGLPDHAREALEKSIIELENIFRYYRHPGVHRLFGIELVHYWPFLLSRLRDGTMADLIRNGEKWAVSDRIATLTQVAHILNYCRNRGLIAHQDLKPDNIFFDDVMKKYRIEDINYVGMKHEIVIADFGIADAFRDIGVNSGSRPYMAPEQYRKSEVIDGSKIDVFALGVIAFECFMDGLHPIGERTADVWPDPICGKPKKWGHEDVWKDWARKSNK